MVGIFDSGIGGLSVVRAIERHLPVCNLIYFGDTARFPYGIKGPEVIKKYAEENAEFLISQGAKIIVVACNTASAVALEDLKRQFPKMPIFGVIEPAVRAAVKATKNDRIGIIGTRATIGSGVYEKKIQEMDSFLTPSPRLRGEGGVRDRVKTYSNAAPLLVSLIEEGWTNRSETKTILANYLKPLKAKKIDTLILGCTHYPFIKNLIQKEMGRGVKLIDCGEALAMELKNLTPTLSLKRRGSEEIKSQFFVSDLTPNFEKLAGKWLKRKIELKLKK